jgi:hypothetical protein
MKAELTGVGGGGEIPRKESNTDGDPVPQLPRSGGDVNVVLCLHLHAILQSRSYANRPKLI